MKLSQDLGRTPVLLELEPEAAQLELRLEPEAIVLCLHKRIQCRAIKVLRAPWSSVIHHMAAHN